jgi:protein-disulfide isomerase
MASRTRQKEEARARRLAEEQERATQAQRTKRLRLIGGVVVAVVAVAAVIIAIVAGSGGGSSGLQSGSGANKTVASVEQLLNGIPQSGSTLGSSSAPVTLTYFGDLECPVCKAFTLTGGWPQLVANEVRSGKVKVVYKAFQTATPDSATFQTQQSAALAAGQQSKFWHYIELFYHEQGQEQTNYVTSDYLTGLAKQVTGLNVGQWQSARTNPALAAQVQSEIQQGVAAGVQGTPTLIFQGPKGKVQLQTAVPSYSDLQQALKQAS